MSNKLKLIIEQTDPVAKYIVESREDGQKNHYITGIFLQQELKNRNGRIYPSQIMEGEVQRYVRDVMEKNRAWGELGHPSGPAINLPLVSHIIKELRRDGNNYIGKAMLTETPMGDVAKGLLNSGGSLAVSSRGLGSLKPRSDGIMEVQNDFRIATAADIVADPSAPDAYVNGIMENVEYWYDETHGSWIAEHATNDRKHVHTLSHRQIEQQKLALFETFIKELTAKYTII